MFQIKKIKQFISNIKGILSGDVELDKTEDLTYCKCLEKIPSKLLSNVFKKNGFRYDNKKYNLYIPCDYTNISKELKRIDIPDSKYIFGLIECNQIIKKNHLWDVLEKTYGRSSAKQIMPESFIINNPQQYETALQEVRGGTVLICKKNIQRKLGLALVFTEEELIKTKNDNFKIAQRFLTNTMQIDGRKMNMRIYYMIRKYKGRIQFFVNTNGKVLYTKDKTGDDITFETHITSFQMDNELYDKENMPHDFVELKKLIGKEIYERIWEKIIDKIKQLSIAIAPLFNQVKFENNVCFQLFGMDVILENEEPYILEINKGPDMKVKCNKDEKLKTNIYESTFQVAGLLKMRLEPSNYVKVYQTNVPLIHK